jgi:hypothetical protein
MKLHTAFLIGFLLGLASLVFPTLAQDGNSNAYNPSRQCGKHEDGCGHRKIDRMTVR